MDIMVRRDWSEGLDNWPTLVPPLDLKPLTAALVVIDMQYCDAHRHYGLGKILAAQKPATAEYYFGRVENVVVPNTLKLLDFFRSHGLRVMFTALGSQMPDYSDLASYRKRREKTIVDSTGARVMFHSGEFEYSFLPEMARRDDELIIPKTSGGAFNSSAIDQWLRNVGIQTLVLTGVVTNACVETTARDAADRGFTTIVVDDACASMDEESHQATLRAFARIYGYVRTADEVIAEFAEKLDTAR